jgi:hypothetical protein
MVTRRNQVLLGHPTSTDWVALLKMSWLLLVAELTNLMVDELRLIPEMVLRSSSTDLSPLHDAPAAFFASS